MTEDRATLLRQTIESLRIRDVSLLESSFTRPGIPGEASVEAEQQHRRSAEYTKGTIHENGRDINLIQFLVSLGTRVVDSKASESEEANVFFQIEATFLVEYEQINDAPEEGIQAFADFNAVHNVWPFWRQHVYDIVARGRLPRLDVPLFAGAPE